MMDDAPAAKHQCWRLNDTGHVTPHAPAEYWWNVHDDLWLGLCGACCAQWRDVAVRFPTFPTPQRITDQLPEGAEPVSYESTPLFGATVFPPEWSAFEHNPAPAQQPEIDPEMYRQYAAAYGFTAPGG